MRIPWLPEHVRRRDRTSGSVLAVNGCGNVEFVWMSVVQHGYGVRYQCATYLKLFNLTSTKVAMPYTTVPLAPWLSQLPEGRLKACSCT